jgi:hypothetical protein
MKARPSHLSNGLSAELKDRLTHRTCKAPAGRAARDGTADRKGSRLRRRRIRCVARELRRFVPRSGAQPSLRQDSLAGPS